MSILVKDPTRDDNVYNLQRKNQYCMPCNGPVNHCPTVKFSCSNCHQKMLAARVPSAPQKYMIPANVQLCYIHSDSLCNM